MRSSTLLVPALLGLFALAVSGCSSSDAASQSNDALSQNDPDGVTAFDNEKSVLSSEAAASVTTQLVTVDSSTDPSVIAAMAPPADPGGATPVPMQGTFWMRGNPLPDYLISFANMNWTNVDSSPYGFLSTFAPGSFAWKEKIVAQGAPAGDFTYVPEICRVPQNDPTMQELAFQPSTYDPSTYKRSVAEDLAELTGTGAATGVADPATAAAFLQSVWQSGQLGIDGGETLQVLSNLRVFYEAQFSPDFTTASVLAMGVFTGPLVSLVDRVAVPETVASFSLAPHLSDPDIYLRKSFIEGVSKIPNYYLLTRIIDGQGNPTAHYQEFLQCVQQRSNGRMLKVVTNP